MRRFIRCWKTQGHEKRRNAYVVKTSRRGLGHDAEYVVGKLNQKLGVWANYTSSSLEWMPALENERAAIDLLPEATNLCRQPCILFEHRAASRLAMGQ